jgi:hypothetical protein
VVLISRDRNRLEGTDRQALRIATWDRNECDLLEQVLLSSEDED